MFQVIKLFLSALAVTSTAAPLLVEGEKKRHGDKDKKLLCWHTNCIICFIESALEINVQCA